MKEERGEEDKRGLRLVTGFLVLIYYPNWVSRHELNGGVKSN
jgi:hypothetical protein